LVLPERIERMNPYRISIDGLMNTSFDIGKESVKKTIHLGKTPFTLEIERVGVAIKVYLEDPEERRVVIRHWQRSSRHLYDEAKRQLENESAMSFKYIRNPEIEQRMVSLIRKDFVEIAAYYGMVTWYVPLIYTVEQGQLPINEFSVYALDLQDALNKITERFEATGEAGVSLFEEWHKNRHRVTTSDGECLTWGEEVQKWQK
jgi:uncharacterized glyoxalase superfamily metalloenzyme YdcJ